MKNHAMNLTPHFSFAEMTRTDTGLPNDPPIEVGANLVRLCDEVLEPIRALLGAPLVVHSGYRSADVNRAVGGAWNSRHLDGRACDFHPANDEHIRLEFDKIMLSKIPYDMLLLEHKAGRYWIHAEIPELGFSPRRIAKTAVWTENGMQYRDVKKDVKK